MLVWIAAAAAIPTVALVGQRFKWYVEDRRWNRFVDRWADVARRNPSALKVLDDCPDISRL